MSGDEIYDYSNNIMHYDHNKQILSQIDQEVEEENEFKPQPTIEETTGDGSMQTSEMSQQVISKVEARVASTNSELSPSVQDNCVDNITYSTSDAWTEMHNKKYKRFLQLIAPIRANANDKTATVNL